MEVTVLRPQVGNGSGEFDATAMELKSAEKQFSIWDLGAGTSVLHQERNMKHHATKAELDASQVAMRNTEDITRHKQRFADMQEESKRQHEQRQQLERQQVQVQQQRHVAARAQLRLMQPVPQEQQQQEDEEFQRKCAIEVEEMAAKHRAEDEEYRKVSSDQQKQQQVELDTLVARHAKEKEAQQGQQERKKEEIQEKQRQQHELAQVMLSQQVKRRSGSSEERQQLAIGLATHQQQIRQQMIRQQAEVNAWQRREQREQREHAQSLAQKQHRTKQKPQPQQPSLPPPITEGAPTDVLHLTMRRCPKRKTFGLAVSLPRLGSDNATALAAMAAADADDVGGQDLNRKLLPVADHERTALSLLGNGTDAPSMPAPAQMWRCRAAIAKRTPQMRLPCALVVPHTLAPDSPAAAAGFRRGDHILSLGNIDVATLVLHSVLECFQDNEWYALFRKEAVREGEEKLEAEKAAGAQAESGNAAGADTDRVIITNRNTRFVLQKLQEFCENTVHPVAFCVRKVSRRSWVTEAGRVKVLQAMVRALGSGDVLTMEVCRLKEGADGADGADGAGERRISATFVSGRIGLDLVQMKRGSGLMVVKSASLQAAACGVMAGDYVVRVGSMEVDRTVALDTVVGLMADAARPVTVIFARPGPEHPLPAADTAPDTDLAPPPAGHKKRPLQQDGDGDEGAAKRPHAENRE